MRSFGRSIRSTLLVVGLASLASLGCSSSSSPAAGPTEPSSASVKGGGTVGGVSLVAAGGLAFAGASSSSASSGGAADGGITETSSGWSIGIVVTDNAAVTGCSFIESIGYATIANLTSVLLELDTTESTIPAGTYKLGGSSPIQAGAMFVTSDGRCTTTASPNATSGTITLTSVSSTSVSGSYDVTFGSTGGLSGTFEVPVCATPDEPNDGGMGACKQP